jgi:tellurite methyltransferase
MIFTEEFPAPPEFRAAHFKHSVKPGELGEVYGDWDVARYDKYVKWDQHPGIPIHCHPVEKLVACKPGGPSNRYRVEQVPVGPVDMPRDKFDAIPMGMPVDALVRMCGEPDVVDTITTGGVQLGVSNITADGYCLSLWFYGTTVMYVIKDRVWGRALYSQRPVRVIF